MQQQSPEAILSQLLDALWKDYIMRVEHAKTYVDLVGQNSGRVINDHIALRTLNCNTGSQPSGITAMLRIFEALGYTQKGEYIFEKKKLSAIHLEHTTNADMPKIFISQLEVAQLPEDTQKLIEDSVSTTQDPLSTEAKAALATLKTDGSIEAPKASQLVTSLVSCFTRPWEAPLRATVEAVNKTSQYAAWTLLHGNAVNHFTAYINKQEVAAWLDIETTVNALRAHGVPMKKEIEGEPGSKLRQSSTEAVIVDCQVTEEDGSAGTIPWSYAYYELAERNTIKDEQGNEVLFNGFLGEQATHLFEMTKRD